MSRKEAKASWNATISIIAHNHENNIKRICEEANIYYPPSWYKSQRGSKLNLIDKIYNSIKPINKEEIRNKNEENAHICWYS